MILIRYVGRMGRLTVPGFSGVIQRNDVIEADDEVARRLLAQPGWERASKKVKKVVEDEEPKGPESDAAKKPRRPRRVREEDDG